jgi:hypothetical protein
VTWDSGAVTTAEEWTAPQGLHGHSILAVSIPTLTTGTHTFTVKATLPSGKTYTSQALSVLVYAQNIYITIEGDFKPKAPLIRRRSSSPARPSVAQTSISAALRRWCN